MKIKELLETAAVGYIAKNKKEANDPRYSMSITQDVKPGEVERQAKKFGNKVPPPLLHSSAAKNSTPNKLMNLGLSESKIIESRGVTARVAGERYINDKDPNDFRVIQSIEIINPSDAPAYKTADELKFAIKKILPKNAKVIDDNKQGSDMRAAIIAKVATPRNDVEYWVRYIKAVPQTGVHSLWQTLRGYSYDNPRSASEKIKLKPSDLIKDDSPKSLDELRDEILTSIKEMGDKELFDAMNQAVNQAAQGKDIVIKNGVKYSIPIAKYAGEYLGAMMLMSGKLIEGEIKQAMSALDIKTLKGSMITFPQARLQELYDSTLTTKDGKTLQISTKMHKTGSGSSLSGVVKQLNDDIESRYPKGAQILRMLGSENSVDGVLKAAVAYKVLSLADVKEVKSMNLGSKDPNIIVSPRLKELLAGQKVTAGAPQRPGYTIRRHLMAAIANKTIGVINKDEQVLTALMLALNNNNYLQVVTNPKITGDDLYLNFYTKYPTEFSGKAQLQNAAFWSTGEQGRIAFSISTPQANVDAEKPEGKITVKRKPAPITAREPKGKSEPKGVGRSKR